MGETQNQPFQLSFNPSLKVDFQGSRVTSDSGLLLVRELDERLGLNQLIEEHLTDGRRGKNTQLPLPDLLRQSLYSRLAGYADLNDAERLSQDPTFRLIGSAKIWERGAALPSRLHWFETEVLTQDENLDGLSRINRELLAREEAVDSRQRVALDVDSTEVPVPSAAGGGEHAQSARKNRRGGRAHAGALSRVSLLHLGADRGKISVLRAPGPSRAGTGTGR